MTAGEITIRPFKEDDFSSIISLTETTYPGREISKQEYLDWEYRRNPDGNSIITIAEQHMKTVAQYAVIPRRFFINGTIIKGSVSVNTLTHPDHRGKDLFAKLAGETFKRCADQGIAFTIGFPNSLSLPVIKKKQIFSVTGSLTGLFCPLKPFTSAINYLFHKKVKSGDEINLKITSGNEFISEFDFNIDAGKYIELINKFSNNKNLTTYRSIDFLKWRYRDIPIRKYVILKCSSGDGVGGVIVLRAKLVYGIRCLIITDLISAEETSAGSLLKKVKSVAVKNNIDLIFTALPEHSSEFKLVKKSGYFQLPSGLLPQKLAFIVKAHLADCSPDVFDFRKWFLTFGDYDIF